MNPFQKNKVDMSAMSEQEQKAFRLYGKLPNRKDILQNKLKERKYFDSGDYALSKAGATSEISPTDVGREHPVPENIPHLSSSPSNAGHPGPSSGSLSAANTEKTISEHRASNAGLGGTPRLSPPDTSMRAGNSGSPVKEGSFLQRETSIDEQGVERTTGPEVFRRESVSTSPPASSKSGGVPIRGSRPAV